MESNRIVTRVSVGIYLALGLPAIVLALLGHIHALLVWILFPVACLVAVLVQFVIFGPLMILTAFVAGRGRREK